MSKNFKKFYANFTFEKRIEPLIKRYRLVIYVVWDGTDTVCYCIASVEGLIGEIDSIVVTEEYRRTGIGTEMMTLALKWLENHCCDTMTLSVAEGNEAALDFYRRFGFAEKIVLMQRTT